MDIHVEKTVHLWQAEEEEESGDKIILFSSIPPMTCVSSAENHQDRFPGISDPTIPSRPAALGAVLPGLCSWLLTHWSLGHPLLQHAGSPLVCSTLLSSLNRLGCSLVSSRAQHSQDHNWRRVLGEEGAGWGTRLLLCASRASGVCEE